MKKFIKNIGKILYYPVKILFIMYCIPAFLVDYIAQLLAGEVKDCHAKWKAAWSIIKFVMDKAMKGEPVTLKSTFGASTKNDSITYCKSVVLS